MSKSIIAAALAATLFVAGCGSGSDESGKTSASASATTATTASTTATTAPADDHAAEIAAYEKASGGYRPDMEAWLDENFCDLNTTQCRCVHEAYGRDLSARDFGSSIVALIREDDAAEARYQAALVDCRQRTSDDLLAEQPKEVRRIVAGSFRDFKRFVNEQTGTDFAADDGTLRCMEWQVLTPQLKNVFMKGVYGGAKGDLPSGGADSARDLVRRIDQACDDDPDGDVNGYLAYEVVLLAGLD